LKDGLPKAKKKIQKTPPPKSKTEERGAKQEDRGAQTVKQQTHGGSGRSTALHTNARSTGGSAYVSVPQSSVSTPFGRALRFAPRHFGDIIGVHFAMRQRCVQCARPKMGGRRKTREKI